jgi:hypothetical protein
VPEGKLMVGLAADVEAIGVLEHLGVAVGRTDAKGHEGARLKRRPLAALPSLSGCSRTRLLSWSGLS